jgi:two-component system phosphate regulon sensor histidine kinase PhoR
LAFQINESGAVIKSVIGVSEIFYVRRKLRSVVYNLVNNAIKYSSPERKPIISITTTLEGEFMVISVEDNGLGIEQANLDKIFTKYERVSTSTEGTGLGLYLIKETVSASGGRITVESELGKGSIFKIYLKVAE